MEYIYIYIYKQTEVEAANWSLISTNSGSIQLGSTLVERFSSVSICLMIIYIYIYKLTLSTNCIEHLAS